MLAQARYNQHICPGIKGTSKHCCYLRVLASPGGRPVDSTKDTPVVTDWCATHAPGMSSGSLWLPLGFARCACCSLAPKFENLGFLCCSSCLQCSIATCRPPPRSECPSPRSLAHSLGSQGFATRGAQVGGGIPTRLLCIA